ncbi:hypothetical protein QJS10_CPB11g02391 [Acorus calamus]|uniref:Katanin p80 WD40 repeat-containing subunit B1 homolog n=1 Tax=Acorus calamus TaxID=4465 RepID=A0AAV9DX53_ACOCL|nr:hypothetical protein QJS10_CPB11g02391 [Acorus calamus]
MATTKRAYKLQEFAAHASTVNCLKIGRKSSRVLVTGGEDHKVNLWAIGKPNAIASLSGHTSAIESVSFDSSEMMVAAGAASGTIKLWDLEEAKVVRTLTGHRSNCISVDFHPFGEFFASGSLDTNLKIWDIRRKGCIRTYKGHSRGVNTIRFTPDGRWVVSGGEDNIVKLWDLTAGKLLHDFRGHEGQIQCIDFHPHEFLLATGSADRSVKFWDLETFEIIGSAGPETTGVRCMAFNPDGRTLLCGLHENLKVFSWEPIRCHDAVDVGWSRLSDLNIHEGKLLGCSHNQSGVGVWVVDISQIEPYAASKTTRSSGHSEPKSTASLLSLQSDNNIKSCMGRLSVSQNSDKETKSTASTGSAPATPPKVGLNVNLKSAPTNSAVASTTATMKKSASRTQQAAVQMFTKSDVIPVIVPRTSARSPTDARKETNAGRTVSYTLQSKLNDLRKQSDGRDDSGRTNFSIHSGLMGPRNNEPDEVMDQNFLCRVNNRNQSVSTTERNSVALRCAEPGKLGENLLVEPPADYRHESYDIRVHKLSRDSCSTEVPRGVRMRSTSMEGPTSSNSFETATVMNNVSYNLRRRLSSSEKETVSASDEDIIADLVEHREQFLVSLQSRLTKLQVIHRFWQRNDVRGAINAMEKMSDHSVFADMICNLMEKSDVITLDICTCLLPLLTGLLDSQMDRHISISLEMLLKLVRTFGPVIYPTLKASSSVGVDLQAEQRLERCNMCFVELEKVKRCLPTLSRRGGTVAKSAQELNLAFQEVT